MPASHLPTSDQIAKGLKAAIPQAQAAWVYGSFARGEVSAASDIDLAVLLPKPMTTQQKWDWSNQLGQRFGREVDLVDVRAVSPVLQQEIFSGGLRMFAFDEVQASEVELFALSQYRDYNERFGSELARIAQSGRVLA